MDHRPLGGCCIEYCKSYKLFPTMMMFCYNSETHYSPKMPRSATILLGSPDSFDMMKDVLF
jgi:hypothetical protein